MINITESNYASYLTYNGNIANFKFSYADGSIIPAWIESNNSGKLIVWLKLNSIPAKGTVTVYLNFVSKTTTNLLSNTGTTGIGEAAKLSTTYGQYDDGASVFNFYDNFAGTTLNTNKWTVVSGVAGTDYSVNNGLHITNTTTRIQSTVNLNQNFVLEDYHYYITKNTEWNEKWILGLYSSSTLNYEIGSYYGFLYYNDAPTTNNAYFGITTDGFGSEYLIWQFINNAGGITINSYNPLYIPSATTSFTNALTGAPITFGNGGVGASLNDISYWVRTRALPPNDVMPSYTFSSVR